MVDKKNIYPRAILKIMTKLYSSWKALRKMIFTPIFRVISRTTKFVTI